MPIFVKLMHSDITENMRFTKETRGACLPFSEHKKHVLILFFLCGNSLFVSFMYLLAYFYRLLVFLNHAFFADNI